VEAGSMSTLGKLILELDNGDLQAIAERLAPFLPAPAPADDAWLNVKEAAAHLGISTHAVHRLVAQREIPFHQSRPNAKCWFRRRELDAWRSGSLSNRLDKSGLV
jgi:excisionase family DNA binding protein